MSIVDLAKALAPNCELEFVGIRPGEKLHEQMIGEEDSHYTFEYSEHYKILPVINDWSSTPERIKDGIKVPEGFVYSSDKNKHWMTCKELLAWTEKNKLQKGRL